MTATPRVIIEAAPEGHGHDDHGRGGGTLVPGVRIVVDAVSEIR